MKAALVATLLIILSHQFGGVVSRRHHDPNDNERHVATVVVNNGVENNVGGQDDNTGDEDTSGETSEDGGGVHKRNVYGPEPVNSRERRLIYRDDDEIWPSGIIPYVFRDDVDAAYKVEIRTAQKRLEKMTCLRFVPWVEGETQAKYDLPQDNHLTFVDESGCWAGNNKVSCCSRVTCLHELGHAVGLPHEHKSPKRDSYIQINYQNIPYNKWWIYERMPNAEVISHTYDMSSHMHYSPGSYSKNSWPVMSVLFKELQPILRNRGNFYYSWATIAKRYTCTQERCPNGAAVECKNDGFVTFLDDEKCVCLCPPGLDPDTGCTRTIYTVQSPRHWPSGTYAMLSAVDGCPDDVFEEGSVQHSSDGRNRGMFEYAKGDYSKTVFKYHFCVKDSHTIPDCHTAEWGPGNYCILKKGTCPIGFTAGYTQFDSASGTTAMTSGVLPEGVYGSNTRFDFCCRADGFNDIPLKLPNTMPFILFSVDGHKGCQEVDGMLSRAEYLEFDNDGGRKAKAEPEMLTNRWNYCYYTPAVKDCGGVFTMTKENPTLTLTSPGYPNTYANNLDCYWIVKAPEDSNILMNFEDFDIEKTSTSECEDHLYIRAVLLGQNAFDYCGEGLHRTTRTVHNTLSINLKTSPKDGRRGFKAHLSLVTPEKHCFNSAEKGTTYNGNVGFVREQKKCIPWTKTTHCPHHAFHPRYFESDLRENYCRNPDNSFRPWCYIAVNDGQCERDYCDVCQLENRFDNYHDCDKLKRQGFCEKNKEKARSLCARTCNSVPGSVNTVKTCPPPDNVPDATPSGSAKSSYTWGESVTYTCNTGSETVTKKCLSDGTWTPIGYACGTCSTGWALHNGNCYKFFKTGVTHSAAQAWCSREDATLARPKDMSDVNFLISMRDKGRLLWLDGTDTEKEGKWVWSDGSPISWFFWEENQPNNYRQQDCILLQEENDGYTWNDDYCEENYLAFVCQKALTSNRSVCVDKIPNCAEILKSSPRGCLDHPTWAHHQCPWTCRVCDDTVDPKQCSVDRPTTSATLVSPGNTVSSGEVVTYQCKPRFFPSRGDEDRVCLANGVLSGDALECQSTAMSTVPSNNVALVPRYTYGDSRYTYVGTSELMRIPKDGEIVQWKLVSVKKGTALLQIWRPRKDLGERKFEFVGQNEFNDQLDKSVAEVPDTISYDEEVRVTIPEDERIQVRAGDMIGVYYGDEEAGITFSECDPAESPDATKMSWINKKVYDASYFVNGKVYDQAARDDCYKFSIRAMVGPVRDCNILVRTNWLPLTPRRHVGSSGQVYSGLNVNFVVPVDGEIAQWKFYSRYVGDLALQVWRARPDIGANKFSLVGQNIVRTIDDAVQTVVVDPADRIQVKAGDYTALYYGDDKGGLPYSLCSGSNNPEATDVIKMKPEVEQAADIVEGQVLTIIGSRSCRVFSLTAFIKQDGCT